jgi:hypothetical protein
MEEPRAKKAKLQTLLHEADPYTRDPAKFGRPGGMA